MLVGQTCTEERLLDFSETTQFTLWVQNPVGGNPSIARASVREDGAEPGDLDTKGDSRYASCALASTSLWRKAKAVASLRRATPIFR